MLSGYLPWDDDPENPDSMDLRLLYKYIISNSLAFPKYALPHARELLARILVPDPRKRANLHEVAQDSWLSEDIQLDESITVSETPEPSALNCDAPSHDVEEHREGETSVV
jgi:serine/threonine protein kinase